MILHMLPPAVLSAEEVIDVREIPSLDEYVKSFLPGGEIMYEEKPVQRVPYAFMRGPVVYSVDMIWNKQVNNDDLDIEKDLRVDVSQVPTVAQKPYDRLLGPIYTAKAEIKGSPVDVVLIPEPFFNMWRRPRGACRGALWRSWSLSCV